MEIAQRLALLKETADKAQREADRAEGALEALRSELKKKFKVSSLKDAEILAEKLNREITRGEETLTRELDELEEEIQQWTS